MTEEEAVSVTQYRVTGQPNPLNGVEFPPYDFLWRSDEHAQEYGYPDARAAAIDFRDRIGKDWTVPPTVSSRVVTTTSWKEV